MSSTLCALRSSPLLASLTEDQFISLERGCEERSYRRRQVVYFAEEPNEFVYQLAQGRVKLVRMAQNGREVTLGVVEPPELFGETQLFTINGPQGCTAEVLEDSVICCLRRADLETVLRESAQAMRELYVLQARRRLASESRLAEFVFYDVSARLAHLLSDLAETYGKHSKNGTLLRMRLTHQELANLIGSTRETTTLTLNDFRRRGLVDFSGRKIIVRDPDQLSQMGI